MPPLGTEVKPLIDRIFAKVKMSEGCWLWTGATTDRNYGKISIGGRYGRNALVHILLYEALVGPVPDGLELDHTCRNTLCVKPVHLEPVTHRVNVLRGDSPVAHHARATVCAHGHPFDAQNTYVKPRGHRACRTCHTQQRRARRARSRENLNDPLAIAKGRH